jgi:hypothetical protein
METSFGEFIQVFGTGVTAGGVMGVWIWSLLKEKTELQDRNNKLTDYIQESDKSNLQILTEMRMLIVTLTTGQDRFAPAVQDIISKEIALLKQILDGIQKSIDSRSQKN